MSGMDSSQQITDDISLNAEKFQTAAHQHGDPEKLSAEDISEAAGSAEAATKYSTDEAKPSA